MTRVYLADSLIYERSAVRLVLLDLKMTVVGKATDWPTMLADAPATHPEMLLVSSDLLPSDLGVQALAKLREACPGKIVIVLISYLDVRQQAALSAGADAFISKRDSPEHVMLYLRLAAARVQTI